MADTHGPDTPSFGWEALDVADVPEHPVTLFRAWFDAAQRADVSDPRAAVVATADADGCPSARTMILREVDEQRGFVFVTSHTSRKGRDIAANPRAALVFLWQPLHRQVTVGGHVEHLDDPEADRRFATQPREAQLAAWAAPQSSVLPDRTVLDAGFAKAAVRFAGRDVPRPPDWGGFRVLPASMEFWQGRADRLHERLRYRHGGEGWTVERLAP